MPSNKIIASNYALGEDHDFISQSRFRVKTFRKNLRWAKSVIHFKDNSDSILDLGCADGAFLEACRLENLKAIGFEINPFLVKWGNNNYNVDLTVGTLENLKNYKKELKVITLWDVLEHLPDPIYAIKIVAEKIPNNGFLLLSLPNTNSLSKKLLQWNWPMHLDVHLTYFNDDSICNLLEKFDFKLVAKKVNRQTLSLGYILMRMTRQLTNSKFQGTKFEKFLLNNYLFNLSISYSIGQTLFIFIKN
jgi:2-polyprenyl-3-methyl-5-hydroxy-6-metoxy-1,4-benzoquinol methylase